MKLILPILLLILVAGCRSHDGRDGANGLAGNPGSSGPMGPSGPAGVGILFSYEGQYSFPQTTVSQTIPGFSLENGDVINVYIRWQNQPWTQIGSTWVGGMAGSYAVTGNVVTITTVIGPQAPLVQWAMNGVKSS